MLYFEKLDPLHIDWDHLNSFPDRTIFQSSAWLSFVATTQNAEPVNAVLKKDGHTVGYFTGLIVKKLGLKILGSPFPGWSTDYMGFNLSEGIERREAIRALVPFAFDVLGCFHVEILDRYLNIEDMNGIGFQHRKYGGFEIDLRLPEEKLLGNMSMSCRWSIRKARRAGVLVEEASDLEFADEYYEQLKDVFAKQSLIPTYPITRVRELIKHLLPQKMILLLRARNKDGTCIATGIFPAMNQTMYSWGVASWRNYQNIRGNEALQWYAIKWAKAKGYQFYDMGGGGEYKRKYGGNEIFVPWFSKSKYGFLPPMKTFAEKCIKAKQKLAGMMMPSQPKHVSS